MRSGVKLLSAAAAAMMVVSLSAPAMAEAVTAEEYSVTEEFLAGGKVSVSKLSFGKIADQAYTGKAVKPDVVVKYSGKTLRKGTDYTLVYKNNKKLGTATVTVKGKGNYTGTKKLTFRIVPGTPVMSMKSSNSELVLSWNKVRGATGYQLYYSVNGGKFKKLTQTGSAKYTMPAPAKGAEYSFKVRAYGKSGKKTAYGAFSAETSMSSEDGTLTVLTWSGNYSAAKNFADQFVEKKNGSVDVEVIEIGDHGEQARDEYRQYLKTDKDADIIMLDSDWVPEYTNSDYTVPLSEIGLSKSDFPDAYDYTLTFGTNEKGEFSAVAYQAMPGAFVYRSDLAKKYLGVNSPEEMHELIKDWDSFISTGKTLSSKTGGKVALQSSMYGLFQVFRCNMDPWVKNGKLNTSNARESLTLVSQMRSDGSVTNVPAWSMEWYQTIYGGSALGEFLPAWGLYPGEYTVINNFSDQGRVDMALCEGPESWYWGGTYFAVTSKCNDPSIAKEFLMFTCGDYDAQMKYLSKEMDFVNNKKVNSNFSLSNDILDDPVYYQILNRSLEGYDINVPTTYDSMLDSVLYNMAYGLLDGTYATVDEALQEFIETAKICYPNLK